MAMGKSETTVKPQSKSRKKEKDILPTKVICTIVLILTRVAAFSFVIDFTELRYSPSYVIIMGNMQYLIPFIPVVKSIFCII